MATSQLFHRWLTTGSSWWVRRSGKAPARLHLRALCHDALGRGIAVGAICGATLALARAGLLAGRAHTSNIQLSG